MALAATEPRLFLIIFSDHPILLENQDAHVRKRLFEMGLNSHPMSSCSGDGHGGSTLTPQAENKKFQSVGTRSTWKMQSWLENASVAFAMCIVQQLRSWYRLCC